MFVSNRRLSLPIMCWWFSVLLLGAAAAAELNPNSERQAGSYTGIRRITIEEAEQLAVKASSSLIKIAKLGEEVAKRHRLGAQADYFPKIDGSFANLHFNKQTNGFLNVLLPGRVLTEPVNVFLKDQTVFNFSLVQPVTPLFAIRQNVIMARADEKIAQSTTKMTAAETISNIEKAYFDTLIAGYEAKVAEADAEKVRSRLTVAPDSASLSKKQVIEMIDAEKAFASATDRVRVLTATLNNILGLPDDTKLELVPPDPLVESISLQEAIERAAAACPGIIEAEQTVIKARAGSKVAKMEYFPKITIIGGYVNQNILNVFPEDASYIGFFASYSIFDFGKREHIMKETKAQLEAAELGLQVTKSKVAAEVKTNFLNWSTRADSANRFIVWLLPYPIPRPKTAAWINRKLNPTQQK
jgi:outer membrane protein TolC